MILDFIKSVLYGIYNAFILAINIIGGTWNFIYKLIVPKRKRNYKVMYKKKKYKKV